MTSHRKSFRLALGLAAGLTLLAGCSGINSTHSVSPASFFLPGLLQADPPAPPLDEGAPPVGAPAAVNHLALAR